ncbi:SocA family protein [Hymenobacter sp. HSC-4F20]|uniref:Panacea domain-containing protein n=1 Tax=Hymenobacter sp. HSC-4F20 TaxID=2864135 RepID=UPI001C735D93|nr:Panacea domain-containing protein [Hymenobacter sp. HSC-4F20]MBX0291944.1 SocA family protein [Hymenobacter sp. HSC-4F20]
MLTTLPTTKPAKIDSTHLCEYIITQVAPNGGVSHLKLQKLLYYIQAYHLAYFDSPVVDDQFQAWVHGPVSRKIYDEIKDFSVLHGEVKFQQEEGEPTPAERLSSTLSPDQVEFINDVLAEFGPKSAYALEAMTHSETPWIEARRGYGPADRCDRTLSEDSMMRYYKQFLYGEGEV